MHHCKLPLIIVAVSLFAGCLDAPRENPLDPSSPNFQNSVSVSGQVTIRDQNNGVASATVLCVEQGVSVTTDSNGTYAFRRLLSGTTTLIASKPGFVADTAKLQLNPGRSVTVPFALNGTPVVLADKITTHKYDQYFPSPAYTVDVTASVTDPNGITDVDSAWFAVDTLLYPMAFSVPTQQFQTTLAKSDFPTNTIDWLVGKSLKIRSSDRHGGVGWSDPFTVTRVIENTAVPTYPTSLNGDTTGSTPLFKWNPPGVTFSFTYTLECLQVIAGTESLVWTLANLGATNLQQQFPGDGSGQVLTQGNYVWRISVIDVFGNSSRSKEAAFVVR